MKYQNQQMTTSNEPLSIASSSSPLSVSSTANLIRPMETESSISSSSSTTTSSSLSHHQTAAKQPLQSDEDKSLECKYKNELYRSSHQIIYKQQLYQHGGYIKPQTPPQIINSSCSSDETTANKPSLGLLYEAKPLNVMMWTNNNNNNSSTNNSQRISAIEPVNDSSVNDTEATTTPNVNEIRQISCV